mmetsp:Transcript_28840/g.47249  ORF Transcript_28840/g.47249 Transcript_28840/m.47249 type:complete len:143 (+) Transcript_28840:693-1121(+)
MVRMNIHDVKESMEIKEFFFEQHGAFEYVECAHSSSRETNEDKCNMRRASPTNVLAITTRRVLTMTLKNIARQVSFRQMQRLSGYQSFVVWSTVLGQRAQCSSQLLWVPWRGLGEVRLVDGVGAWWLVQCCVWFWCWVLVGM